MVEQAHRRDSFDSVVNTINNTQDSCEASINSKMSEESFKLFLEYNGKFWEELHDNVVNRNTRNFVDSYESHKIIQRA